MSTIEITLKKIYGLNKIKSDFTFKSDAKHNFIYGINAIGKTSVSKGLELLTSNRQYKKLIDSDSDEYLIDFNFDNLSEKMSNDVQYNRSSNDLSKRLFIFNKKYLNQHISLVNAENSNIQIGIRVAERERYINDIDRILENVQKDMFEKIKNANLKSTKDGFTENSNIIKLKSSLKNKSKERKMKQDAFEFLIDNAPNFEEIFVDNLKSGDFNGNNLKTLNSIKGVLNEIIAKVEKIVNSQLNNNSYKINSIEDKEFYDFVIRYLKDNSNLNKCPICKNSNFNKEKIIEHINQALTKILEQEIISKFDKCYSDLEKVENSSLIDRIKKIYNKLLKKEIDVEEIKNIILTIDNFNKNYDYYLLKFINYNFNLLPKNEYYDKKQLIKEINEQNNAYSENDLFIDKLNEMLSYIFEDDELKAEKFEYDDSGNKYYGIQLIIDGVMKKGISIEDFWSEILSESQKTKISLSFMFSVIIFNNYNGKILCIFDDPIDSYDSINKHKMSRIIYEFISKKGIFDSYDYDCYDIIFSHSIEYLRLFKENLNQSDNDNVLYWVMSAKDVRKIKKDHLFILRGDFNILNSMISSTRSNNVPFEVNKFISLIPIMRELSSISRKTFDNGNNQLNINNNIIVDLDHFLSENVVHGFSKNIKIKDLVSFITNYIDVNVDNSFDNEKVFDYIKDFLDDNISNLENMDFYEQIFFKNIMSIYIRAKYDYELATAIKNCIPKYNNKSLDEIHNDFREISKKVAVLYKDVNVRNQNIDLLKMVSKSKPMLNDFSHSANIFLTPLIDVTLKGLKEIYDNL